MFENCSSITTLNYISVDYRSRNYSFASTFINCINLSIIKNPIDVGVASQNACQKMFYNCTSLSSIIINTKGNWVIDEYLKKDALKQMFYGCSSLTMISSNLRSWYDSASTDKELVSENWLYGVSPTGNFYYSSNQLDVSKTGNSFIPVGWTIHKVQEQ